MLYSVDFGYTPNLNQKSSAPQSRSTTLKSVLNPLYMHGIAPLHRPFELFLLVLILVEFHFLLFSNFG